MQFSTNHYIQTNAINNKIILLNMAVKVQRASTYQKANLQDFFFS